MKNIEKHIKDILYNDIQEKLETRESFKIQCVDGLWFKRIELEGVKYKIEDENDGFVDIQTKTVHVIRNEIEKQMDKLEATIGDLNKSEIFPLIQQPRWEDLEFDLDSIIYELELYKPREDMGTKGKGKTTVEIEYQGHDNVDYIEDFIVKFEYELEGDDSHYVVITDITTK